MHQEILSDDQKAVLPFLKQFGQTFYMVGGTSIALHIGHRRSIDFDLFTNSKLNKSVIKKKLSTIPFEQKQIFEDFDQLHVMIYNIKTTFFSFPYVIEHKLSVNNFITIPSLIDLASMKAFALGRRAKWKDYVDLYFLLKFHFNIKQIGMAASKYFGDNFSEKLFREQLAFHKDIDYSEPIDFVISPVPTDEIKSFLIARAIDLEN